MKETKLEFSIGIWMSHKLAADETTASNYEFITPVHLFCGLTKLEDTLNPMLLPKLGLPPHRIPTYETEVTQLLNLFKKFKIKPREVRRAIRDLIGDGGYHRERQELISRSGESHKVFERAGEIAQTVKAPEIAVQHLLAAICEIEKEYIPQLFKGRQVNISDLYEVAISLPIAKPTLDELDIASVMKSPPGDQNSFEKAKLKEITLPQGNNSPNRQEPILTLKKWIDYVETQLKSIRENLARQGVRLDIQDAAAQWLVGQWHEDYDPQLDARPLLSLIQEELSGKIDELIHSNQLRETHIVRITLEQGKLQISYSGDETLG